MPDIIFVYPRTLWDIKNVTTRLPLAALYIGSLLQERGFTVQVIDQRVDERGSEYPCTAEDAVYATFELENGVLCQFNSSWAVRVRRDDLLTHPFEIEDGYLKLPTRPGLGSDLIEEELLKHPPAEYPGAR